MIKIKQAKEYNGPTHIKCIHKMCKLLHIKMIVCVTFVSSVIHVTVEDVMRMIQNVHILSFQNILSIIIIFLITKYIKK